MSSLPCFFLGQVSDEGYDSSRMSEPGAMYYAAQSFVDAIGRAGPDGKYLIVCLPNGQHWAIDMQASNCTRPDDKEHRCWVRHGTPPNITVDKNGETCGCGCSIMIPYPESPTSWHGFLRNGFLEEC